MYPSQQHCEAWLCFLLQPGCLCPPSQIQMLELVPYGVVLGGGDFWEVTGF